MKLEEIITDLLIEKCWKGYQQYGMKQKDGKEVPNCIPVKEEDNQQGSNEVEMIQGIAEIIRGVHDAVNREELATKQLEQLQAEGINIDKSTFFSLCGVDTYQEYDVDSQEDVSQFISFMKEHYSSLSENTLEEAEYQGRKVPLGKPMRGDIKKFKVYVKNPKTGKVVKVNFGQKGMVIKKNNPKRRKSFRARMHCDNPGPKTKANYWSCRAW